MKELVKKVLEDKTARDKIVMTTLALAVAGPMMPWMD